MSYLNSSNNGIITGLNFIKNPKADHDTTGWATYADAAGTRPVNGTGGSPTVTLTRSTTSPLDGVASFLLTKDAANRQGEGASYDMTLPAYMATQMLSIKMNYSVSSGTFAMGSDSTDGDVIVYAYDVTNSALVEPISFKLDGSGQFSSQLQVPSGCTSLRLIFHVASTSASAWVLKLDNIIAGPVDFPSTYISAPSDVWVGTGNGRGSTNTRIRRFTTTHISKGSDITYADSSTDGGSFTINTAGIYAVEYTDNPTSANVEFGISLNSNQLSTNVGSITATDRLTFCYTDTTQIGNTTTWVGPLKQGDVLRGHVGGTGLGDVAQVSFRVTKIQSLPGVGAEGRIVAARYKSSAGQSISGGGSAVIDFATKDYDTHSAVTTGASWKFTAPQQGYYDVKVCVRWDGASGSFTAGNNFNYNIRKNGVSYASLGMPIQATGSYYHGATITSTIPLVAGDYIDFSTGNPEAGSRSFTTDSTQMYITIERVSGPSQLPAESKVFARYTETAGQSLSASSYTRFNAAVKDKDSHSAVTTGGSWVFTAPRAGTILLSASALAESVAWSSGNVLFMRITYGSSTVILPRTYVQAAYTGRLMTGGCTQFPIKYGETVYVDIFSSQATTLVSGDPDDNHIEISYL